MVINAQKKIVFYFKFFIIEIEKICIKVKIVITIYFASLLSYIIDNEIQNVFARQLNNIII